ncbi:hypothetical protein INF35_05830 [Subdoligranulum sp. DSM 109015]|uniref:Uncharacterized protein n=1 Tax=Gemmiger gallinarum TaxID=2779354 RepID=A0ABR9R2C6_9FIRM|nr:hypothetical protein [Gemmiger gallinarum]MBE5037294.1 hypothetical protein [Gemmiger gallinarum]
MKRMTHRCADGNAECNMSKDICFALHQDGEKGCWGCDLFPEIIDRLASIEGIIGDDYDLDRLRELVEADKDGRIKIVPNYVGKACGTCDHFHRVAGTRRGTCDVKPYATSRYGTPWPGEIPFEPSQSRIACKQYEAAEAAIAKEANNT